MGFTTFTLLPDGALFYWEQDPVPRRLTRQHVTWTFWTHQVVVSGFRGNGRVFESSYVSWAPGEPTLISSIRGFGAERVDTSRWVDGRWVPHRGMESGDPINVSEELGSRP